MQIQSDSPDHYISLLPAERREAMHNLREVLKENLPVGFEECISYGMIGYVIPHSLYPAGYHCDPTLPLPFVSIASQKNFIALYHMGLYAMPELLKWFEEEYPKHSKAKLDMGKSCIRFKKPEHIPFKLIAELAKKINPQQFINVYETHLKR